MKVKFLVPEIDRDRWAEEFNEELLISKLKSKDLSDIGAETNSEQRINKYKNGAMPKIDGFLTLCRFFNLPPDSFLFANPKWVECDIDFWDAGISKKRLLGVLDDICYVVPFNEDKYEDECCDSFDYCYEINLLTEEPNPSDFLDFHLYGTNYDLNERVVDGKIIYRFPYMNKEKTSKKIFSLLEKYKISNKHIQALLDLSPQSLTNRRNQSQEWTVQNIYKLSWVLNMPFESLVEIDYREETREALFDPIVFIMHYQEKEDGKDSEEAQLER